MHQPVMLKTLKLTVLCRSTIPFRTNTQKRCPFHYRGLECKSRKSRNTWLLLLQSRFSRVWLQVTPLTAALQALPSLGIFQARILEWIAISFSSAWKWKAKMKSLSRAQLLTTLWTAAYQAPPSMGFSRQEYWSGLPLSSLETPGVTGKFGLGVQNKAGQKLIDFAKRMHWSQQTPSSNNTREDSTHGHHQMVSTKIRLIIFFATKDGEALYSQQKQGWELTVAQIMNSLFPNSDLNWRK